MEVIVGVLVTLLLAVVGWILHHSSQCSAFHERQATLEAQQAEMNRRLGALERQGDTR